MAKSTVSSAGIGGQLAEALREAGASLVGFADVSPFPAEARRGLPCALSIATALDAGVVAGLEHGPTGAYHAEYVRVNGVLERLARLATNLLAAGGHRASFGPVTVRATGSDTAAASLPHKTVATRAGLGWIGHSALLVTREHGPTVRLTSVFTDAPLACEKPIVRSRCGTCRRCVDACPATAISGRPWRAGLARERFYDAAACREKASALAAARGIDVTICGICIRACPWTQRFLRRAQGL
jgi:epoxyqueuosine reductase QueG